MLFLRYKPIEFKKRKVTKYIRCIQTAHGQQKTKKKPHSQEKKQGPQVAPSQSTKSTIEDGPWIIKTRAQRFYKKIDLILCFILCLLYIHF